MSKKIASIILFIIISQGAFTQESRDYLSDDELYTHAMSLFDHQLYPSAYEVFYQLLTEESVQIIPNEQRINTELYQALSATFSGKDNGIALVNQFINKYPEHPNTSLAHLELGKYYFNNKQFTNASLELQKINPDALTDEQLIDYHMSLGYTQFIQKKFSEAERHLNAVAMHQSEYKNQAIYYLGLSQYFQKKYDLAKQNLKRVEQDPKYQSEIPSYYARILFEEGNYGEIISYLEPRMSSSLQQNVELNQILGQSYFNLEQYEQALPYLERYSKARNSQSPEALYQLAYTQYKLSKYSDAIKNFEQLNILDNELGQYSLYALGESYIKVRDNEKALRAFSRASKLNYNATIQETSRFIEAKLSYELGRNNDAIQLMQQFRTDYPRSKYKQEADELLVELFLTSTNYKEALNLLQSMRNRSQQMNEAYQKVAYYRAVELYNSGDMVSAKPLFDLVIEQSIDPRYTALANYWLGEMAYEYSRYPIALDYMQKFLSSSVQKPEQYIAQANYTVGYSLYNQDQFTQSIAYFSKVPNQQPGFGTDASLRLADAYFMEKNYSQATQAYKAAFTGSPNQQEYASYQIAILKGLQGQNQDKLSDLKSIYTTKPNSAYADDALFQEGRVYSNQEQYAQAKSSFRRLIQNYPNSELVKQSYNEMGLIDFNQSNYEEALQSYEYVVENYPNTDEASSAIQSIKEIYIQQGRADSFIKYANKVGGIKISDTEEEQILYLAAETPFKNGDCATASSGFSKYLNKFPNGFYSANAHFYRGECLSQTGKTKEAILEFEQVVNAPENKFQERSLIRIARYFFLSGQYDDAITAYLSLQKLSGNSSIYEDEVLIGLMQSYNKTNNRKEAVPYANKVLQLSEIEAPIQAEAKFIQGWHEVNQSSYEAGQQLLTASLPSLVNPYGAEARYLLAKIFYEQNQYNQSIEAAYRVSEESPSEDDWVAKSFLLIGLNYKELGELFQAKATFQSVLENYSGTDQSIMNMAKQYVREIEELEESKSTISTPSDTENNQLQLKEE